MKKFSDQLAELPNSDHVQKIELYLPDGSLEGSIENKPGSQGSVRVYQYLAQQFGSINPQAAKKGLEIYAEHTQDAEQNPGKHPNIDRLFEIVSCGISLQVKII
ncbi:MAG: DUF2322 family protein [Candidatus Methylopumilus sp.]|jgi:hypothetical protein|nr:DUF2322 family protein [Candidatus Methylopumilus sp.]NBW61233.1 DUF2322 family protein [Methylophilaceae bacterium]